MKENANGQEIRSSRTALEGPMVARGFADMSSGVPLDFGVSSWFFGSLSPRVNI
jgi:hypothetical protein